MFGGLDAVLLHAIIPIYMYVCKFMPISYTVVNKTSTGYTPRCRMALPVESELEETVVHLHQVIQFGA
jgi:hypothetical protein